MGFDEMRARSSLARFGHDGERDFCRLNASFLSFLGREIMNWTVHTWWAVRGGDWETLWIRVGKGKRLRGWHGQCKAGPRVGRDYSVIVAMPSIDPACKEQHYYT